jgi:L-ascorbate metabolism protein UlaG (beta-lactamase superfamily)
LRYLGWSAFEVTVEDGRRFVLDPLLIGEPKGGVPASPARLEEFDGVDLVLVTHAASDHVGQAFDILGRSRALLVCDLATRSLAEVAGIHPARIFRMVPGVEFAFDGLLVKALPAEHLSFGRVGTAHISAPPLSFLVTTPGGVRLFFGGDTSITANHELFGRLYRPHVAALGVGGVDANGRSLTVLPPKEAALAAKWLRVKVALPIHYRFDEGERFVQEVKRMARTVKPVLLKPGECISFPAEKAGTYRRKSEESPPTPPLRKKAAASGGNRHGQS